MVITNSSIERLYNLVPSIYQLYDRRQDEALRALLALLEQELRILESDIDGLYDNWFIETCDDWVVPYIGDLLDVQRLSTTSPRTRGQERRAYVANTLAYRRRKGTTTVLEQLAQDVSGWRGKAVEFLSLLARTGSLMTGSTDASRTADLRRSIEADLVGSPFGTGAFTAEIRSQSQNRGRYGVPNIGLFLWRLQSYPIERVTARRVELPQNRYRGHCYTFSPLGFDRIALFNQPQTKIDVTQATEPIHVPGMLLRSTLYEEIQQRRIAQTIGQAPIQDGYFGDRPVLQIFIDGQTDSLMPEQILIANLDDWNSEQWQLPSATESEATELPYIVAVDPELGRLAFLNRPLPKRVEVSHAYGFSGDLGGGTYDRRSQSTFSEPTKQVVWTVQQEPPFNQNPLATAIETWHRTTKAWQNCRDGLYIPIARVDVPAVTLNLNDLETGDEVRSQSFQPGIVRGLNVMIAPGTTQAIVLPGTAIDSQGRVLKLRDRQTLSLDAYKNKTVLLVISYRNNLENNSTERASLEIVPANTGLLYSEQIYIRLSLFSVDIAGKAISQSSSVRRLFQPGIVRGLKVKLNDDRNGAIVTSGLAINAQGKQIKLDLNYRLNLSFYREQEMLLVFWRRSRHQEGQAGQRWQIALVPASDAEQYPPEQYLRLARIRKSQTPLSQVNFLETTASRFRSGVLKGLNVVAYPGQNRAVVTAGVAIGTQGESISIHEAQLVKLRSFAHQTISIVLTYQIEQGLLRWQIEVVPQGQAVSIGKRSIVLGMLDLDEQGCLRDVVKAGSRSRFKPGILSSLSVTEIEGNRAKVEIAPGAAVNRRGQLIRLDSSQTVDLSSYSGKRVIVYVAYRNGRGWKLGTVIDEVETGVILLNDNATYGEEDLTIKIPAGKQLQIIAANGNRPHIRGDLAIEGMTQSKVDPGELILEGLLIEGRLTLVPGNLKTLQISHCTIVPQTGGLFVAPVRSQQPETPPEWSLITIVMYYISVIRQMLRVQLDCARSPAEILARLLQFGYRVIVGWMSDLMRSLQSNQLSILARIDPETNYDQLHIRIDHSICGALHLTETIPQLTISDSVIDSCANHQFAIAAPGTQTIINTTTILGSTAVLSLEASNSLFNDHVAVWRRQIGCLRFCSLPDESQTPHRFRCQPDQDILKSLDRLPTTITTITIKHNPEGIEPQTILFLGTAGGGIYRSTERGNSWQAINTGLSNQFIHTIAVNPNNGRIYAGATNGCLFESVNDGEQWTLLIQLQADGILTDLQINTTHINALVIHNDRIFAGTLAGRVFRSPDWFATQKGLEQAIWNINALAIHPQTKALFAGTAGTGIYYSTDHSESWQKLATLGLTNQNITALAIADNGDLFAGTTGAPTQPSGIFYSRDNGVQWTLVTLNPMNYNVNVITIHPNNQTIFVGTANRGLIRSTDQGKTWEILTSSPSQNITAIAIDAAQIFIGTAGGLIWRSIDNGDSWISINTGIENVEEKLRILRQLQPIFTSLEYGNPGYAQLSCSCTNAIRMGAEDGSELGSFNSLKQPQREANLRASLDEYLRFGLETELFYIT